MSARSYDLSLHHLDHLSSLQGSLPPETPNLIDPLALSGYNLDSQIITPLAVQIPEPLKIGLLLKYQCRHVFTQKSIVTLLSNNELALKPKNKEEYETMKKAKHEQLFELEAPSADLLKRGLVFLVLYQWRVWHDERVNSQGGKGKYKHSDYSKNTLKLQYDLMGEGLELTELLKTLDPISPEEKEDPAEDCPVLKEWNDKEWFKFLVSASFENPQSKTPKNGQQYSDFANQLWDYVPSAEADIKIVIADGQSLPGDKDRNFYIGSKEKNAEGQMGITAGTTAHPIGQLVQCWKTADLYCGCFASVYPCASANLYFASTSHRSIDVYMGQNIEGVVPANEVPYYAELVQSVLPSFSSSQVLRSLSSVASDKPSVLDHTDFTLTAVSSMPEPASL